MCECYVCVHVHMGVGAHGNQVRVLDPLELELEAVVSHLVLGRAPDLAVLGEQ